MGPVPFNGYGTMQQFGHVDFYPNGGKKQPGCWNGEHPTASRFDCSHNRACYLFADTIKPDESCSMPSFESVDCDNYENYLSGECDGNFKSQMGYYSEFYIPE